MVMHNKHKVIYAISGLLIIIGTVMFIFKFKESENRVTERDHALISFEQYTALSEVSSEIFFNELGSIELKNAWLIFDFFENVRFYETGAPYRSRVDQAAWILSMLNLGVIGEITFVQVENTNSLVDEIVFRITDEMLSNTYYVWYQRALGLQMVTSNSYYGEVVYHQETHRIIDGEIREN